MVFYCYNLNLFAILVTILVAVLGTICSPFGRHSVSICSPFGCHLVTIWSPFWAPFWAPYVRHLFTIWSPDCSDSTATIRFCPIATTCLLAQLQLFADIRCCHTHLQSGAHVRGSHDIYASIRTSHTAHTIYKGIFFCTKNRINPPRREEFL